MISSVKDEKFLTFKFNIFSALLSERLRLQISESFFFDKSGIFIKGYLKINFVIDILNHINKKR